MYEAKDSEVRSRQLKTQRMVIPVLVTASATPASKTIDPDEPSLIFLKTEGLDQITLANGAVDSQAELDAITFATSADATGVFSVLMRVNEPVEKVASVKLVERATAELVLGTAPTGASAYVTSAGDKIVANLDSGINLSTTNGDYVLEVEYFVD